MCVCVRAFVHVSNIHYIYWFFECWFRNVFKYITFVLDKHTLIYLRMDSVMVGDVIQSCLCVFIICKIYTNRQSRYFLRNELCSFILIRLVLIKSKWWTVIYLWRWCHIWATLTACNLIKKISLLANNKISKWL